VARSHVFVYVVRLSQLRCFATLFVINICVAFVIRQFTWPVRGNYVAILVLPVLLVLQVYYQYIYIYNTLFFRVFDGRKYGVFVHYWLAGNNYITGLIV
jgi:magnesium-transporting ATPase (P-type)